MANIYIRKDEVYRTRIEDITDKEQFFYPVYVQAKLCLEGLVRSTDHYWQAPDSCASTPNPIRLRGYPNNIIAFNADRGHGKTSAMLSFSTALETMSRFSGKQQYCKSADFWTEDLRARKFFPLESIDPTTLEYKDSIIPVIISRMFTHFTEHAKQLRSNYAHDARNGSGQILREHQQQLLQLFQRCYRLADGHKGARKPSENYDDLQLLADRGDSSNFKAQFASLVSSYLHFMCMDCSGTPTAAPQKAFLIIQIDDADMNPDHAYEVVEDIRKYCVLPNVVILFATNLEQLEMCVEQHFLRSFEPLLKSTVQGDTGSSHTATQSRRHCHSTAVNYLDKLVPSLHRINLPNIDDSLQNYDEHVGLHHDELHTDTQRAHPEEYRVVFEKLLRRKCLLDIHFDEDIHHPFLPKHMRELTHFLNRLMSLNDIVKEADDTQLNQLHRELMKWALNTPGSKDCAAIAQIWKENLETMMNYLVNDWSELSLKSWQMNTIQEIHRAGSDRKIAMALESMEQNYFRYKGTQAKNQDQKQDQNQALNLPAPPAWEELLDRIHYFRTKQDHVFSSALELYFQMHKELLMVCDYIKKREEVMHNGQH